MAEGKKKVLVDFTYRLLVEVPDNKDWDDSLIEFYFGCNGSHCSDTQIDTLHQLVSENDKKDNGTCIGCMLLQSVKVVQPEDEDETDKYLRETVFKEER